MRVLALGIAILCVVILLAIGLEVRWIDLNIISSESLGDAGRRSP
jgi:hypothetical protein